MVAAFEENRNLAAAHSWRANGWSVVIVAEDRRKYIAIDETDALDGEVRGSNRSGRFLVDRETGDVFTIRGYGQRGHRIGTVEGLTEKYRAGSATFDAEVRAHVETSYSKVASWGQHPAAAPARPQLRLIHGGA